MIPQNPRSSQGRASGSPTGSKPNKLRIARSSRTAGGCAVHGFARAAVAILEARDQDCAFALVQRRHVHGRLLGPKAEERAFTVSNLLRDAPPRFFIHDDARRAAVLVNALAGDAVEHCRHPQPSNLETFANQPTSAGGR